MKIIIHNDDFALSYGFSEAIKDSYLIGVTSSTSLRVNGTAYEASRTIYKKKIPKIGMGIHLNLTDGKAMTKGLANSSGNYKYSFLQLISVTTINKYILKKIRKDFEMQILKAKNDGFSPDHIDSQEHVHMIPIIFKVVCQLCQKYKIRKIRFSDEPFYFTNDIAKDMGTFVSPRFIKFLILKYFAMKNRQLLHKYKLKTTDKFYGILHTNDMDYKSFEAAIRNATRLGLNTIELLGHPAYSNDKRDKVFSSQAIKEYVNSTERRIETRTFTDKSGKVRKMLKKFGLKRITFRDLT